MREGEHGWRFPSERRLRRGRNAAITLAAVVAIVCTLVLDTERVLAMAAMPTAITGVDTVLRSQRSNR
jgi:hypothetical protein